MAVSFAELEQDFLRLVGEIVWCTMATVDSQGRPRTRILHTIWEVVDGSPVGFVGTSRSPLKTRHLETNPFVSCSYWRESHDTVQADCRASWAEHENERIWELFRRTPPPLGYDPGEMPPWKDGPLGGAFTVLRLDPWRINVRTAEDLAAGRFYERVWAADATQEEPSPGGE